MLVNAPVAEVGEAVKQQLLVAEHCTSNKDQIEYVSSPHNTHTHSAYIYTCVVPCDAAVVCVFRMSTW